MKPDEQQKAELKPCPFCGRKDITLEQGVCLFFVGCDSCEYTIGGFIDEQSAAKKWNTRP